MYKMRQMPKSIIKYTICLLLLFLLINLVPDNKVCLKDAFVLALLATLSLAVLEHLIMIVRPDIQAEKFERCVEAMEDIPAVKEDVPPVKVDEPVPVPEQPKEPEKNEEPIAPIPVPEVPTPEEPVKDIKDMVPKQIESEGSRAKDGEMLTDLPYDTDFHHLPMADDYKSSMDELGYWFLPPEKWYPTPPFPPVCVSEKKCPVCPIYTTGAPIDVKEWNTTLRVTQPDRINTTYVKEKLNSGR